MDSTDKSSVEVDKDKSTGVPKYSGNLKMKAVAAASTDARIETESTPLVEQIMNVFFGPTELFDKLQQNPTWVASTIFLFAISIVVAMIWAFRVDVDLLIRPGLEASGSVPAYSIDKIVNLNARVIYFSAPFTSCIRMGFSILMPAWIFQLLSDPGQNGELPTFKHALSASALPNLVLLPRQLLTMVMMLIRPVGGATLDQIWPTSLGYYLHMENSNLNRVLFHVDPFFIGGYLVTFLALRRILRMKAPSAIFATLLCAAATVLFEVYVGVN